MTVLPEPHSLGAGIYTPNLARMYDYYLGGSYNFAVDRDRADQVCGVLPCMTMLARSNRGFLRRAVRFMADAGIKQFIDIGSGIPTNENTHDVAQARVPGARVVYVDNEPIAVAHGKRILHDTAGTAMIQADVREPGSIVSHPEVTNLIDFSAPVGVLLCGVLVFIPEDADAEGTAALMTAYREACAPGSYIAVSHLTHDEADEETREQVDTMVGVYRGGGEHLYVRDRETLARWFDGLELVPPGVTLMDDWHPDQNRSVDPDSPARWLGYGGVARVT
jgi:S-adenosyl methyltransferase